MPAEWERHHATWIGWPHNASDWPGRLGPIPWVYAEIVRKLAPGGIVRILVNSGPHQRKARSVLERAGVDLGRVEFFRVATNRGWTRDFGPLFVRRPSPRADVAIARFRFNAWAKYPDWKKDDRIPERVAARLKLPLVPARGVLEGGGIDGNVRPAGRELPPPRGEPRAGRGHAPRGRLQDRGRRSPDAHAALFRRPAPAGELRQLLHRERRGPGPDIQRSPGQGGVRDSRRAVP